MQVAADPIDDGLDGRVDDFHDDDQETAAHEQRPFDRRFTNPPSHWNRDQENVALVAQRRLRAPPLVQAAPRISRRRDDAPNRNDDGGPD